MQHAGIGSIDDAPGYLLKQAAAALNQAMTDALAEFELSVAQYSCLEQLQQRPGTSNAALARGTFVTPQSMNEVLRGLERRGLIVRPVVADRGRALPAALTAEGQALAGRASAAVADVQRRMLDAVHPSARAAFVASLRSVIGALRSND